MNQNRTRIAILMTAGVLLLTPASQAMAEQVSQEISLGGFSYYLDQYYNQPEEEEEDEVLLLATQIEIPKGIAIANVNDYVNIRENPGTDSTIVGILTKNAYCIVTGITEDGWARISSGEIQGYIKKQYLFMDEEGAKKAKETTKLTARVTAGTVNVRTNPTTLSSDNIITEVTRGEELEVVDERSKELLTKTDPNAQLWVKVVIDNSEGYVSREFVSISYTWPAATRSNAVTGSAKRNLIVAEAKKYIGLRYVWGGESLTTGADCSGYLRAVYQKCGVDISLLDRTSYGMAAQSYGRDVTLANAQPGDFVFYGNSSGKVDHMAMYIGNGLVIHESGSKSGCKISNVNYRSIIKIKNMLD